MTTAVTERQPAQEVAKWEDSGIPPETVGLCRAMVQSGYFPDVKTVAQAIVKVEMGRSMNLAPVESLIGLHILPGGKVHLGYQIIGALLKRSGKYDYRVLQMDDEACEIEFLGRSGVIGKSVFTIEKARAAGLVRDRGPWRDYPQTMLYARALKNGAYRFCPDALGGAEISEEPFFEGSAVKVIDMAPDETAETIYNRAWAAFWSEARNLGLSRGQVHELFGVALEDGALVEAATKKSDNEARTLPEVIAEMADRLVAAVRAGDVPAVEELAEWEAVPE